MQRERLSSLLSSSSHSSQSRRRTEFDETFKLEVLEENILSLDPTNGRSELVSEKFDEAEKKVRNDQSVNFSSID